MAEILEFRVGHCTHPGCMVLKGGSLRSQCFPARAYLLRTRRGNYLWDTGYAEHFHDATAHGLYRLYARVTPVTFDRRDALVAQLAAQGIRPADLRAVIVSHFHADHIAGLRDFPGVPIWCGAAGWRSVQRARGLTALRQGFLPGLLPDDVDTRLQFVEACPPVPLPPDLAPFTEGRDPLGDGELYIVDLPGHAPGHLGLFVATTAGWVLLAADAAWVPENYRELRGPSELSFLVQHDRRAYYRTLQQLQALHRAGGAEIRIGHQADPPEIGRSPPCLAAG